MDITLTPRELARFEAYIDKTLGHGPWGNCWPWLRYRNKDGYGMFGLRGKMEKAHRIAYLIANGRWPTPQGQHECNNPPCCNPDHIEEGTTDRNMKYMVESGRAASGDANGSRTHPERVPRGEAHGSTKFSDEVIEAARAATGTLKEIGARFGMSYSHVCRIKHGVQRIPPC